MTRRLLLILFALASFVAAALYYQGTSGDRSALQGVDVERASTSIEPLEARETSSSWIPTSGAFPDQRQALSTAADLSESPPAESTSLIRVPIRSAHGVPLRNIERSPDGLTWEPDGGLEGEVLFRAADAARWYRAAGHVALKVDPTDEAAVLESDLVITFQAKGLAASIRKARVEAISWNNWQQVFASHGAVGDDTYTFAIDPEYGRSVFHEPIGLELHLMDHTRLRVEPNWNARGLFRIDVDELLVPTDSADVRVIARCAHEGAECYVEYRNAGADLQLQPDRQGVWGRLLIGTARASANQSGAVGAELRFAGLPVGIEHLFLGRCTKSCLGRSTVVPNDSQTIVDLPLSPRAAVSGLLRTSTGERQVHDHEIEYVLSDSPVFDFGTPGDYAGLHRLTREGDGWFEIRLPERVLLTPSATWPPPRYAHLEFRAGGFRHAERTVDLHDPRSCDLGVIELEPLEPDLLISSGHDIPPFALRSTLQLLLTAEAALSVEALTPAPDGSLLVFLKQDSQTVEALARWRALPSAHALLTRGTTSCYPFERTSDGRLRRMPFVRAKCDVYVNRTPPALGAFHYGYRWNDIDHPAGRLGHEDVGTSFSLLLNLPAGPLDVWWNTTPVAPNAGEGGWAELRDGRVKLVIE